MSFHGNAGMFVFNDKWRHLHYSEITAYVLYGLIPNLHIVIAFFVCIPNLGQAVSWMFQCLSIDQEEITVLFPR